MLKQLKALMQEEFLHQKQAASPLSLERQPIFARQPVFDANGKIWGYELLYRSPVNLQMATIVNDTAATASVILNGFEIARSSLKSSQKLLINFTGSLIETQVVTLLPPEICIIEILENVQPTPSVLDAVRAIKAAGYTIALDDYMGQEHLRPFLPLVDIVKIDVLGLSMREVAQLMLRLRGDRIKAVLLAEKVEDEKTVRICRELGFSLFQGYFFSKPEVILGKKMSTSQAVRMRILALCINDDVDMRAVSEAVLHDPIITARFLSFANSAYFSPPETIRTVYHALTLVGTVTFMQWICVIVLATLETSHTAHELAVLASQRAKFLECLGKKLQGRGAFPPDLSISSLFLTGLFSLLESVMRMPLPDILADVPLDPDAYAALTGRESPYTPWLKLMDLYEQGEWEKSIAIAHRLNLVEQDLPAAYSNALEWCSVFFMPSTSPARDKGFGKTHIGF